MSSPRTAIREGERPGAHPPSEQYLEAILTLEEEGSQVIQARLAETVGHSAPTVSEMVQRLRSSGYIDIEGRLLHLTASGRELAASVTRKHRLAECLLTQIIGLPWHKVHAEADRWEHVISDEVEARLVDLLGDPTTCPHGNVIPGNGHCPEASLVLSQARPGDLVRLSRISAFLEPDTEALAYLEQHGFTPGAQARVAAQGPDGSLVLETPTASIVVGAQFAELMFYVPVEEPSDHVAETAERAG
ncbi:MAG TPA: metal-dependent transcriptional regulator [Acidimicrobiales bacterium]|nr:metal-dependent transcriptional regulator [Acidimicrobiales bacterium]